MALVTIQQAFDLALQHHQAGRWNEAAQLYQQILAQEPKHVDAMHNLGVLAYQSGRKDLAEDLMRRAVTLMPNSPEVHDNLGNLLREKGQFDEAITAYRQAIALKPDYAKAHFNLGNALKDKGQLDDAIVALRQAIILDPNWAAAHSNLGIALKDKGLLDEAIASYRRAIALRPDLAEAHSNLGNALREMRQLDEAIAAFRQAIALNPRAAESHNNLGNALKDKGQLDEAIAGYRQAINLKPGYAEAHYNLGIALTDHGQLDEAVAAFRRAILLNPKLSSAYANLANALRDMGELDDAIAAYRQALRLDPANAKIDSNLLYALHFHPSYDAQAIAEEHRRWDRQHAQALRQATSTGSGRGNSNDRNPDRRLRIGYVSPDFRIHAIGRFLMPLYEHRDHGAFEIFSYAGVLNPDEMTDRFRECSDHWRSVAAMGDEQLAQLVRDDRIDILVDLTMHLRGSRLLLFARKPAPVQVTYLAYCSTTGLSTIDYRISDPYLDPPAADESCYSEKTMRLPRTYWCYQVPPDAPAVTTNRSGPVTFGNLNNFNKVTAPTLAMWAQILRETPGSQMLIHAMSGSHRQRVWDHFAAAGVERSRVRFSERLPMNQYFELYSEIDIALDSFPHGGGTTTCDSLWMGVPVISRRGGTAVSRHGFSILSNVGLSEFVASNADEYVSIAATLAADRLRLATLRATLRERLRNSAVMDEPAFVRDFEQTLRAMWLKYCSQRFHA